MSDPVLALVLMAAFAAAAAISRYDAPASGRRFLAPHGHRHHGHHSLIGMVTVFGQLEIIKLRMQMQEMTAINRAARKHGQSTREAGVRSDTMPERHEA